MASFIERHVRRARMVVQFDQALVDDEHPTPGARRREIATRDEIVFVTESNIFARGDDARRATIDRRDVSTREDTVARPTD